MYTVYSLTGELTSVVAAIVGVIASAYLLVSLFRGWSRCGKAILSILVWTPASYGMFYAYFVGHLLIGGWNQKNEDSALYGALVLLVSTAIYLGLAYGLMRWIEYSDKSREQTAPAIETQGRQADDA